MTANVQGSASSIGMAPASSAGAGSGVLPSLTSGAGTQGTSGAPSAAGAAGVPTSFDPTPLAAQGRWLGPLLTVGGGAMAIKGFQAAALARAASAAGKGGGLLKWGGIAAALGGIALTAIGFKAKGIQDGTKATEQQALTAFQTLQQQYQQSMDQVTTEATTQIAALQQQLAQARGVSATPGTNPSATPGVSTAPSTSTPGAAWSLQGIMGTSVQIGSGSSASGVEIASAGTFRLEQAAGDANGYATLAEANAAARDSMSTELMGSRFLRWLVIEHDGRYYGVIAKSLGDGEQASTLQAAQGNVVAWSAMNHVEENGEPGWQAFTWSKDGGSQSIAVPYGTTHVFGTAPATSTPSTGSVDGGGGAVAAAFDPAGQVGRTFSINAASTPSGVTARGGVLQLQRLVASSASGFATAEEATQAARQARDAVGSGSQWARWVTVQGSDGRFYAYEGSIVARPTADLEAAPVHVFGAGFAEYYDSAASAWTAVADQQAA